MIKQPEIINKVWGHEEIFVNCEDYCGKKLILKEGAYCSTHSHFKREHFVVEKGFISLALETENNTIQFIDLDIGDCIEIPRNKWHSFYGVEDSEIIEFSTPDMESKRLNSSGTGEEDDWRMETLRVWSER